MCDQAVNTDLRRIGEKARRNPRLVFTSLYHHVSDVDTLRACYEALPGDRAVGVDAVTKEHYAITDDGALCNTYDYRATRILLKWLNRKSQHNAYTWGEFNQALAWVGRPRPPVRNDLNPFRRAEAC
jgi:hypothetical protein